MNLEKELATRKSAAAYLRGIPARQNGIRIAQLEDILYTGGALAEIVARVGAAEIARCNRLAELND